MNIDTSHNSPWRIDAAHFPAAGSLREKLTFLLGYAVLAPSSHNTQPWQFRLEGPAVEIFLDEYRWLQVADADQRELHISVGCALENLLVAAEHFGLGYRCELMPDEFQPLLAARVTLTEPGQPSACRPARLFDMLTVRHTNHRSYDGRPIPPELQTQLVACCVEPELMAYTTEDQEIKRWVDNLVVQGDAIQFAKPEFCEELAHWIGQGVFGSSWLIAKIGQFAVSHFNLGKSQGKKDSELLQSSPMFVLLASHGNRRLEQIKIGQVYQRMSLLAAAAGVWCQPMSQLVEVEAIKRQLASLLPDQELVPQHPFRLGFAEAESRHTPRRPLAEVVVD